MQSFHFFFSSPSQTLVGKSNIQPETAGNSSRRQKAAETAAETAEAEASKSQQKQNPKYIQRSPFSSLPFLNKPSQ